MTKYRDSIEEFGLYYEKQGFSPVAARVMIYLLLHPENEATFEELVSYFEVSKSAVSNAIKLLMAMDLATERKKPGIRKRFFGINLDSLFSPDYAVRKHRETRQILEKIENLRSGAGLSSDSMRKASAFIKLVEEEYERLYRKVYVSETP